MRRNQNIDRDEVADAAAEAIWVSEWASAWERLVEDDIIDMDDTPYGPGEELSLSAPEVPEEIRQTAQRLLDLVESKSGRTIEDIYGDAQSDPCDVPSDEQELGYQLGMVWLGHGVGVADSVHEALRGLHGEVLVEVDPETEEAEVMYSSLLP